MEQQLSNSQIDTQPEQVVKKSPKLWIIIIVFSIFLIVAIAVGAYFYQQSNKRSEEISSISESLEQKNQEISETKAEQERLSEEISSLESQISEYIKKINELENPPYFTNYLPVKFVFDKSQKMGQSFHQEENKRISSIQFKGSFGIGNSLILNIYELNDPKTVELTNMLAAGKFPAADIAKESLFIFPLDRSVQLMGGKDYFITVESEDTLTQAGLAFAEQNIVDDGKMFVFTRTIGGNGEIIDSNHSWQPRNNYDVIFELK
ncbi:hypothetical protein A2715_05400 [Candidatus Woesebacteria bacterium RIFCSPHIGHO2_01_FULL_39_32]|uniref:Uncharacterized protein n=1 Tax=Candidatus Woesebacteria bacterium RIFCSPLOWO2_01_FULL_39_25 TaxID=1802521 RepID=A0A1F8BLP5_9BACT|nr:MAG: hypothetical protein A2715_05400 [Candidatus Woesebacteria bacterium RIFCSPHIGHO2_01_FULL_39_32]OGM38558.1 MAG: hypothetical protein A3F01_04355 [Candidatus Woesebacteria bacterium RIFCSPHIGHO2_12_FULL_38_11]OGM64986.1 MAG: hypothetical protein A2893_05010 [Candidatus Woesebacteria bacterium RIFCSPLOWO2_01_FULL_39_25]